MAPRKPRYRIGLILSNASNDFSGRLMEDMSTKLAEKGYDLLITLTNHSIEKEREALKQFASITDGILIISDAINYSELEDVVPTSIPVIFLNRKPEGCKCTCIIENDYSAVYQAILSNSVAETDKIALICGNQYFSTTKEIAKAYRSSMETTQAGFHEDLVYPADVNQLTPEQVINELVAKDCYTIFTTTQSLTRLYFDYLLLYNRNHKKPVTLIGFSNQNTNAQTVYSFDTVSQPLNQLVDLAVQQIFYLIRYPKTPIRDYLIKGSLQMHVHDVL